MKTLRVGVDAWGLSGDGTYTGIGQYTASLLKWVPLFAPIEMVAYGAPGEPPPNWLPSDVQWRAPGRARTGRLSAIASRIWWLPAAAERDRIDVLHAPGVHVRPSSPPVPAARCPVAVTVHDVIPLSYYGAALPRRTRKYYSWNLSRALKTDRILTVSGPARDEIARYTGVSNEFIEVVTSAVDFAPNRDRTSLAEAGIEGPYILYAGSYEPRKDLLSMLSAFDRFSAAGGALSLVAITERSSGHASAVHASLALRRCRDKVRLVHSIPDRMLRALYTHAVAVVFPSLAEGLGLPALQAAACGVPVVASDLPVLRETVGDIAVFAHPGDSDSLLHALVRVSTDPSARAVAARLGPLIAAKYSPEASAADHAQVYWSCHERRHALA
ncbi:MAG TPA: glycosyltransferase family 1 protein [Acidimicrobiales bacterium]